MAIEHVLTDADTLRSLAMQYGVSWEAIADYNSLEYPYTLTSKEAYNNLYAGGYLTITRELFQSDLIFYKGSQFATKVDSQGIQRIYEVVDDSTIPAGERTGYIYVRCVNYGTFGNTIAFSVTLPYKLNTSVGEHVSALTITNEEAFTNGTDATVKVTGQSIYIPTSEAEDANSQVLASVDVYLNYLGGEDYALAEDGDMVDDIFGDIGTVVGLENIKQAIRCRLMSESGSLAHHPEYGTRLAELIGMENLPFRMKLMELDVLESLGYEDRLESVTVNSVTTEGTATYLDLSLEINKTSERYTLVI